MMICLKLNMSKTRELSKLISRIENFEELEPEVLKKIFSREGSAHRIGLTGPPGAGKSTLSDALATRLLNENKKVGILAVDPTSPFTGGAILGDRIRMTEAMKRGAFIRSIGTRGGVGGISRRTYLSSLSMEAYGMDCIIIETVGVGQSDFEIKFIVDTTVVVLTPESGDYIQAMKAGLMEIGDIYVINKSDREGAKEIKSEIESVLLLLPSESDWKTPVILTKGLKGEGIDELKDLIIRHRKYLEESGLKDKIIRERRKRFLLEFLRDEIWDEMENFIERNGIIENFLKEIEKGGNLEHIKRKFLEHFARRGSNP